MLTIVNNFTEALLKKLLLDNNRVNKIRLDSKMFIKFRTKEVCVLEQSKTVQPGCVS